MSQASGSRDPSPHSKPSDGAAPDRDLLRPQSGAQENVVSDSRAGFTADAGLDNSDRHWTGREEPGSGAWGVLENLQIGNLPEAGLMGQGVNRGQAGKREEEDGGGGGGRSRLEEEQRKAEGQGPGKPQGEEGGQAEAGEGVP